jgi:simple sugar transport system ATP-binding protein
MHLLARQVLEGLQISIPSSTTLVSQLSGGQRQAIAIGRAATSEPQVLILDEPTSALAVQEVESVLRLIRVLSEKRVSVVLVTHRLQDLFQICDRVVVLYEGLSVANRRVDETTLNELVHLIVGDPFTPSTH